MIFLLNLRLNTKMGLNIYWRHLKQNPLFNSNLSSIAYKFNHGIVTSLDSLPGNLRVIFIFHLLLVWHGSQALYLPGPLPLYSF